MRGKWKEGAGRWRGVKGKEGAEGGDMVGKVEGGLHLDISPVPPSF